MDLTNQSFGRWLVLERAKSRKYISYWKCVCECGTVAEVAIGSLRRGLSKSCGCLNAEVLENRSTTHGMSRTKLHGVWCTMKARCHNPNSTGFHKYGARGISVCPEWRESFEAFAAWAWANGYDFDLSIDRVNNAGNYCAENCRWATRSQQTTNQSKPARREWIRGTKLKLHEVAALHGLKVETVRMRMNRGRDKSQWFAPIGWEPSQDCPFG